MIKKITASVVFSFFTYLLFSQDTIYKTDGSKIIAKIIEVNATSIKYKFVDGNETVIENPKITIAHISYSNGLKEMYNTYTSRKEVTALDEKPIPINKSQEQFLKNIFAINVFEMAFVNFSCSYERIFGSGKIGLKLPISFGMGGKQNDNPYLPNNNENATYLTNKIIGSGLEFNYYPIDQMRHTFYVGLSGVIGSFNYYQNVNSFYNNPNGSYYTYTPNDNIKHTGMHYAGMLHIGCYFGLSKNILLGGKFGIGYKKEETVFVDYTHPKLQLDMNLAYRF